MLASSAAAQDPSSEPAASPAPAQTAAPASPTPPEHSTTVEVDEQQRALEREQASFETEGQPSSEDQVIEEHAPVVQEDVGLSHIDQVGLRVGAGVPFLLGLKYAGGPACSKSGDQFCHRMGASFLDLDLSWGMTRSVELTLLTRLGLSHDEASGTAPLVLGLGVRAYGSPESIFKLFLGGRLVLDLTQSDRKDWQAVDIGARGEFGFAVDVVRYVGFYVQGAVTLSFLRAFVATLDASGGLQVRFP